MLCAVVLVEVNSDRVALQALTSRSGRDLAAEGIRVVAMDGITYSTNCVLAAECAFDPAPPHHLVGRKCVNQQTDAGATPHSANHSPSCAEETA